MEHTLQHKSSGEFPSIFLRFTAMQSEWQIQLDNIQLVAFGACW